MERVKGGKSRVFIAGLLCGWLMAAAAVVLLCLLRAGGRRPPQTHAARPPANRERQRRENRNFLYYDGTEMPKGKEETE